MGILDQIAAGGTASNSLADKMVQYLNAAKQMRQMKRQGQLQQLLAGGAGPEQLLSAGFINEAATISAMRGKPAKSLERIRAEANAKRLTTDQVEARAQAQQAGRNAANAEYAAANGGGSDDLLSSDKYLTQVFQKYVKGQLTGKPDGLTSMEVAAAKKKFLPHNVTEGQVFSLFANDVTFFKQLNAAKTDEDKRSVIQNVVNLVKGIVTQANENHQLPVADTALPGEIEVNTPPVAPGDNSVYSTDNLPEGLTREMILDWSASGMYTEQEVIDEYIRQNPQ